MYIDVRPSGEYLRITWPSCGLKMASTGLAKVKQQVNHRVRYYSSGKYWHEMLVAITNVERLTPLSVNNILSKSKTRSETQIQTKLDQPLWKYGLHQTPETRPQLKTSRKKRPWTTQETMAMRRRRNMSNDLMHGERWWWSKSKNWLQFSPVSPQSDINLSEPELFFLF